MVVICVLNYKKFDNKQCYTVLNNPEKNSLVY